MNVPSKGRIAILWHLHQPEYRDPETGIPVMPWTRLHALRGYRDLLIESAEHRVPWTLNIVPGLWEQILYYAAGGSDRHLDLTRREVALLSDLERHEIGQSFPCGNPMMRANSPRYREIEDRLAAQRALSDSEILDLQVLSTLVWTGSTARRDHPELARLAAKDHGFDEADRAVLLAAQSAILKELPALLTAVARTPGPALSTSPLHHPILPLLIDVQHAARCQDQVPDVAFAFPEDARLQLERGRARMAACTGSAPLGCWPSEGSVSPETVQLVGEAGFRWLATDDAVLARSDRRRLRAGAGPWDLGHQVRGFFRDHALSDRVGFDYANWPAEDAAADLFARVDAAEGLVVVALDGENPWEAFEDAGHAFRAALIAGLKTRGVTLDAAASEELVGVVETLHTGSWIAADFQIWAGSDADADAWRALSECRHAVEVAESGREQALEHVLAAEGSDWFWWYGPEFDTPFSGVFDAAFRSHLTAAWRAIGATVPLELSQPIERVQVPLVPPARPHDPQATGYAEWLGAGRWVLPQGSMARGSGRVVRYAWDSEGVLWLRLPDGVERLTVAGEPKPIAAVVRVAGQSAVEVGVDGATALLERWDWVV